MNMNTKQSILLIYPHPDDETLFSGGIIAKYAQQGATIHLVTATRGEKGRTSGECPQDQLATTREQELRTVGKLLGIKDITFLNYGDKTLAHIDSLGITQKIAQLIREICPQVLITFGPEGANGHEDHKAIHTLVQQSITMANDHSISMLTIPPFPVPRVYYVTLVPQLRHHLGLAETTSTPNTTINTKEVSDIKLKALQLHRTQALSLHKFLNPDHEISQYIFDQETFTLATEYSVIKDWASDNLLG